MGQMFSAPVIQIDFKHKPEVLLAEIEALLDRTDQALEDINKYEGQPEPIRAAISQPKDVEVNTAAAVALSANVTCILGWYSLAEEIAKLMIQMANEMHAPPPNSKPAVAAAFAKLLAFCFRFDSAKMMQPAVQNDFSGYRRVLNKVAPGTVLPADEAHASIVSMFVAETSPFTSVTAKAFSGDSGARRSVADIGNTCAAILDYGRETEEVGLYLDSMVSSVVVFDRASNAGVFTSRELSVRKVIAVIKKRGGTDAKRYLNAVKFSTVHYSDAPAGIQRSLE